MGLFSPKKKREIIDSNTGEVIEIKEDIKCCVCGAELGAFNKNKITRDFYICDDCAGKSAIMRHKKEVENYSDEALKELIQRKSDKADTALFSDGVPADNRSSYKCGHQTSLYSDTAG